MRGGTGGDITIEPSNVALQLLRTMFPVVWNLAGICMGEVTTGMIAGTCPPTYWRWSRWIGANRRLMQILANIALSHPKATLGSCCRADQRRRNRPRNT